MAMRKSFKKYNHFRDQLKYGKNRFFSIFTCKIDLSVITEHFENLKEFFQRIKNHILRIS
jgi:hypothetical protein